MRILTQVLSAFLAKYMTETDLQEKGGRLLLILTRVLSAFLAKYLTGEDLKEDV